MDKDKKARKQAERLLLHLKSDLKAKRVKHLLFLINKTITSLYDDIEDKLPTAVSRNTFRRLFDNHVHLKDLSQRREYNAIKRNKIVNWTLNYLNTYKIEWHYDRQLQQIKQNITKLEKNLTNMVRKT